MSLGPLTKVEVNPTPAVIAELEQFVFSAQRPEAGDPTLHGYYDRRGKLRRIVGRWPDGWKAQLNIDANGYVTSARASLKLTAQGEGENAQA